MRMLFSIAGLLLVVYLVMKLGATQLQALKAPVAADTPAADAGAPGGTGPRPSAAAARDAAERVKSALEQGAAARAVDPAASR
jgi:hypothetical protein